MPLVFLFVLGFSFVLLLVAFHSIVIPIKAILLNLLSTGASYGLLVLVFQEGWAADILNVKPGVIESFVPVFIFTILFGLSMDYHVFILTRIKEARDRGLDSDAAVERGISITAGTITSAAAIMVAVFAVFVTLELNDHQAARVRAGRGRLPGRDGHPERAAAGVDAPARASGTGGCRGFLSWIPRVTIEGESDAPELEGEDESGQAPAQAGGTA